MNFVFKTITPLHIGPTKEDGKFATNVSKPKKNIQRAWNVLKMEIYQHSRTRDKLIMDEIERKRRIGKKYKATNN